MGAAITDFFRNGRAARLRVFSSMFEEDELPVKQLFRSFDEMPPLERWAVELARGRVLDAGAGAGCHALALQARGHEVCAIDISGAAVEVMRARGVQTAVQADLMDAAFGGTFDTILLLMNGSGLIGSLARLPHFFARIGRLLAPAGRVLMDSSDLVFLYEDEDGNVVLPDPAEGYYGEVDFRMRYKNIEGDSFDWLYLDFDTLCQAAARHGFTAECLARGEHYDYLAEIRRA